MKITLNFSQFMDNWPKSYKDQFSYNALKTIFNYLENYEQETGEELEFDPIAICCDFSEEETALDHAINYFGFEGMTYDEDGGEIKTADEVEEEALRFLRDNTLVLEFDGGVIIQKF